MAYAAGIQEWLTSATKYLVEQWGLHPDFAAMISKFLLYLTAYSIRYTITSGYRSQKKQNELRSRYERGDKGIIVAPAKNSAHSASGIFGNPAANAIDISTSNHLLSAQIAVALGIGAGYYYKTPDPVHFYRG